MQSRPAAPLGSAWTWHVLPQVGTQAQRFSMKDKAGPGAGLIKKLPIFPHINQKVQDAVCLETFPIPVFPFGISLPLSPNPSASYPISAEFLTPDKFSTGSEERMSYIQPLGRSHSKGLLSHQCHMSLLWQCQEHPRVSPAAASLLFIWSGGKCR